MEKDFIDELMGFDPQNLTVFNEPESTNYNENIYKTNPKNSKEEDGHYRSKIRIIYNPFDAKQSIVNQATYAMSDTDGFFMVRSKLANGDKTCPLFASWKKLWFSNDDAKKDWAKKMYDKTESQWCLVQILEDGNQPEMVGKFKVMKLPKVVWTKMSAKMNPAPATKKAPMPIMDYLIGYPLEMDVQPGPDDPKAPERKQREISYDLCEFASDPEPIVKVDGTPLFEDAEMELIENYVSARNDYSKAKTEAKKAEHKAKIDAMMPQIKELYKKALDYVRENAVDLVKECAYQEWDENTKTRVNNWITVVAAMQDPKVVTVDQLNTGYKPVQASTQPAPTESNATAAPTSDLPDPMRDVMGVGDDNSDDLPF